MAKIAPTPGPWLYRTNDTNSALRIVAQADGVLIASSSWHSHIRKTYPLRAEATANIRLMTAAPELLEIAKNFAAALEWQAKKYDHEGDDEGARLARLNLNAVVLPAIDKAEGRA